MTNLAVKEVEFNGDVLMAAHEKDSDKVYVGVSWICNGIGFNKGQKDRQVRNVQDDIVLKQGCFKFEAGVFDPNNETLAIELDFLPLWLAKISITPKMQTESPEITDKLIEYQLKAKDVLANAFIKGVTQIVPTSYKEALMALVESIEKQEQLELTITKQAPKVDSYDQFIDAKNNQVMNDVAKSLGVGRNKLFAFLRKNKVLMEDNIPYQRFIDSEYFVVREYTVNKSGYNMNVAQTFVTPKGVDYIGKMLRKEDNVIDMTARLS